MKKYTIEYDAANCASAILCDDKVLLHLHPCIRTDENIQFIVNILNEYEKQKIE